MSFQSILVTGANRGIGLEFVRQLLSSDPPPRIVIATTRTASPELNQLRDANKNLHLLNYDASNFDSYESIAAQVQQLVGNGGLDLLINNAGAVQHDNLDKVTAQNMVKNFEVNTVGPLMLTKALLPVLKLSASNRKTVVANISSLLASIDDNKSGAIYPYRASKVALNMISKSLSIDLAPSKIIVLPLNPGHVKTDMGGPTASIDTLTSVSGLLNVIRNSDLSTSGNFYNFDGKQPKW